MPRSHRRLLGLAGLAGALTGALTVWRNRMLAANEAVHCGVHRPVK